MINFIKNNIYKILLKLYGEKIDKLSYILKNLTKEEFSHLKNVLINTIIEDNVQVYPPYSLFNSYINSYTYIAQNSIIRLTTIGKFCSIGANFVCGWGIHPTNGISTSPMFYSTQKQNGISLSNKDKIEEVKPIMIGNDVYIGMNVTVLDGVTIGNGAIIGAGCVVSKDVPPYAIVVGCPMKIVKYRFSQNIVEKLQGIKWWDWDITELKKVEEYFFYIDEFIKRFENNTISNEENKHYNNQL